MPRALSTRLVASVACVASLAAAFVPAAPKQQGECRREWGRALGMMRAGE
jgi:hypothetical protein